MDKTTEGKDTFWPEIYGSDTVPISGFTVSSGHVELTQVSTNKSEVQFHLSASDDLKDGLVSNIEAVPQVFVSSSISKCLATFDPDTKTLEIFPMLTWQGNEHTLPDKYEKIKCIRFEDLEYRYAESRATLEGMLKKVPKCFLIEHYKGLGFKKEYLSILEAIEEQTDCTKLVVTNRTDSQNRDEFLITPDVLQKLSREIDNINSRANSARHEMRNTTSYNVVAGLLDKEPRKFRFGRHPIRKLITEAAISEHNLDVETQKELISVIEANARSLIEKIPDKIEKLRGDLELATLDELISKFEKKLTGKLHKEKEWQKFFKNNPIILSLATSYPVIFLQDEASIGGRKLDGKGEKIADYIYKNKLTDNALVVEIKTPQENTLSSEYRSGVYSIRSPISGAVNQVRDQKYKLIKSLADLKQNAHESGEELNLETFSVSCLLVVGKTPDELAKRRSWELFRGGLVDVAVITFDELLEKLKNIRSAF